jgi:DNA-binding XRE family transcriptional regulator
MNIEQQLEGRQSRQMAADDRFLRHMEKREARPASTINIDVMIGRRLRTRRRLAALKQSDVAMFAEVKHQQIHKYETGESRISASVLFKIARGLGVSVGYFFEEIAA